MDYVVYDSSDLHRLQSLNLVDMASDSIIEHGVRLYFSADRLAAQPICIGSQAIIRSGAVLYGGVKIGSGCEIDHGVVIRDGASIGDHCRIEHGSEVGSSISMEEGNHLLPHSVVIGKVQIGRRNVLGPFITIGSDPQHPDFRHSTGVIIIGDDNVLREYVTVHMPTTDNVTRIGNGCYIMAYNHFPHDVIVQDGVKMANDCQIGGHTAIMHGAYLGLSCVIHQRITIGPGTMVGMGSVVVKDIPPYVTFVSGVATKLNYRGALLLERSASEQRDLLDWYLSQGNEGLNLSPKLCDRWWYADMKEFLALSRRKICSLKLEPTLPE